MLGLLPHMASRREDHGTDTKGQWNRVQLTDKQWKAMLIITACRVRHTYPSETGYSTAYM